MAFIMYNKRLTTCHMMGLTMDFHLKGVRCKCLPVLYIAIMVRVSSFEGDSSCSVCLFPGVLSPSTPQSPSPVWCL